MDELKLSSCGGGAGLGNGVPGVFTKGARRAEMLDEWNDKYAGNQLSRCHVIKALVIDVTDASVPQVDFFCEYPGRAGDLRRRVWS